MESALWVVIAVVIRMIDPLFAAASVLAGAIASAPSDRGLQWAAVFVGGFVIAAGFELLAIHVASLYGARHAAGPEFMSMLASAVIEISLIRWLLVARRARKTRRPASPA